MKWENRQNFSYVRIYSKFKDEIIYANAALGRIGDKSDIPLLEMHENSSIQDIRDSAGFAIERIRKK